MKRFLETSTVGAAIVPLKSVLRDDVQRLHHICRLVLASLVVVCDTYCKFCILVDCSAEGMLDMCQMVTLARQTMEQGSPLLFLILLDLVNKGPKC